MPLNIENIIGTATEGSHSGEWRDCKSGSKSFYCALQGSPSENDGLLCKHGSIITASHWSCCGALEESSPGCGREGGDSSTSVEHIFKRDDTRICRNCYSCTGFGSRCTLCSGVDRTSHAGGKCGCGPGDSGCVGCGLCRQCAKKVGSCTRRTEIFDATRSLSIAAKLARLRSSGASTNESSSAAGAQAVRPVESTSSANLFWRKQLNRGEKSKSILRQRTAANRKLSSSVTPHTGKMRCNCALGLGHLTYPLDGEIMHQQGSCVWDCCQQSWNSSQRCSGLVGSREELLSLIAQSLGKYNRHKERGMSELLTSQSGRASITVTSTTSSKLSAKPASGPRAQGSAKSSSATFYDFGQPDYRVIAPPEMLEVLSTVPMPNSSEYYDADKGRVLFVGLGLDPTDYSEIVPN